MHLLQPSSEGAFRGRLPSTDRGPEDRDRVAQGRVRQNRQIATTRGTPTLSSTRYHQGDPHLGNPTLSSTRYHQGDPHLVLNTLAEPPPPGGPHEGDPHLVLNVLPPGGPPSGPQPASRTATTRGTPTWSSMCYHQGDPHLVLSGPADPSTVDQLNPGSSVQRQYTRFCLLGLAAGIGLHC
ncbi:unnamed protein product [Arctogadus glacialis]